MGVIGAQYRRVSGALSTCCRVPVMAAPAATMIWSDDGCEGISLMEDWDPVVKQMRYWFQMERRKADVMTVPRLGGFPQVVISFGGRILVHVLHPICCCDGRGGTPREAVDRVNRG